MPWKTASVCKILTYIKCFHVVLKHAETTHVSGGGGSFLGGVNIVNDTTPAGSRPLENKAQNDTCINLDRLGPRSTFQRGFC